MTAITFRILGYVTVALGLAWVAFVLVAPSGAAPVSADPGSYAGVVLARLILVGPGLGLVFTGLLMLAIGKALLLLDRIAVNGAAVARDTAAIGLMLQEQIEGSEGLATVPRDFAAAPAARRG